MQGPSIVLNAIWWGFVGSPDRERTDYGTLVSNGSVFSSLYKKLEGLWRTGVSWLCKNTEGWLTAPFGRGGAQLSDIWLWFVYVCCQRSPPPGKSQSLKTCPCVCQWYKIKWVCDVGVWLWTSCSCNGLVTSRLKMLRATQWASCVAFWHGRHQQAFNQRESLRSLLIIHYAQWQYIFWTVLFECMHVWGWCFVLFFFFLTPESLNTKVKKVRFLKSCFFDNVVMI